MSNDEQICQACKNLEEFGIADKCIIHAGAPVDPFEVTAEMAEHDKFGEVALLSDKADREIAVDYGYAPSPSVNYPEAKRPEARTPVA